MSPMRGAPMGAMPPEASQMPQDNQVNVDVTATGQGQLKLTVSSPGGTFDVAMTMESATMLLMKLAQVIGQAAGIPPEELMAELGGGPAGGGGLQQLQAASGSPGTPSPAP